MNPYIEIQNKLHQFTKKYYQSELIKGSILFLSLGCLYFLFTLFIEYFLWLSPSIRTLLFWLFIAIEFYLFTRFIILPVSKLIGIRKGLSDLESSKIIGNHFPEVSDKLLNIIQLHKSTDQSDLILASIAQKSTELEPIPFVKAIDFKENIPYLKYAIAPILLFIIIFFTDVSFDLKQSFNRVVKYNTAFVPPAPFQFQLLNENLEVIQGKDLEIKVKTLGKIVPNEVKLILNNQQYYLQNEEAIFSYTFFDIQETIQFHFEANGVVSLPYTIDVIETPMISNIQLAIQYPNYLSRESEVIQNNAQVVVPEGSSIEWKATTLQTDTLSFLKDNKKSYFRKRSKDQFVFQKTVTNSFHYQISSSNDKIQNYESLDFSISVIKDEPPNIFITTDIDSITRGNAQFAGQITDDYGIHKVQVIYYNTNTPNQKQTVSLPVTKENIQSFYYQFPASISLKEGENYELYFEVYDNDELNRYKKTTSRVFTYRQKTEKELKKELLQEQKNTIQTLENTLENQQQQQEELKELQFSLQNKKDMNWNDKKKLDNFVKRQDQYKQMMQRQTQNLLQNLDEIKDKNTESSQKKELLKERIQELQRLEKQQRLLDEIQKMADKLNKEDLVNKAKELAQQNRQQQRSLEKTLEMVKRFYVEQKSLQLANSIENLSKQQETLSKEEDLNKEAQDSINAEFQEISKELQELEKDNEQLKDPLELPDVQFEQQEVESALQNVKQSQNQNDQSNRKKNQKKAAQKMQEMSAKMQQSLLEMQSQSMEENIDDLRKILENLILFSFEQEQLMNQFDAITTSHPAFGKSLQKQNDIKTYFNHIDDSLYVLAMRVPDISTSIQDDLSSVHYNIDQSLENFSENRFSQGIASQRYVMTSTNNLADYLSNILNSMQNNLSMKMGNGQQKNNTNFSLPDLIQKQGQLSEKMKDGLKKSNQKGNKEQQGSSGKEKGQNGNSDSMDGELYEIYKQQTLLRQEIEKALNYGSSTKDARKVIKSMEELENEMLLNGFTKQAVQKMQLLNYELLKLQDASFQQGVQQKRKSNSNESTYQKSTARSLYFKKRYLNQIEILNRQSLPLQQNYKKKVRKYFSNQQQE